MPSCRTVLPVPYTADPSSASQLEAYLEILINAITHRAANAGRFAGAAGGWQANAKGSGLIRASRRSCAGDHLAPGTEGSVADGAVLTGAQAAATELDVIEDAAVSGREALPGRLT